MYLSTGFPAVVGFRLWGDVAVVDSTGRSLGATGARSHGCAGQRTHVRREPGQTALHAVVREHLETFLSEARLRGGGDGLPGFVEQELRELLTCGAMARGFAGFRCDGCAREILVAFSCKGRLGVGNRGKEACGRRVR